MSSHTRAPIHDFHPGDQPVVISAEIIRRPFVEGRAEILRCLPVPNLYRVRFGRARPCDRFIWAALQQDPEGCLAALTGMFRSTLTPELFRASPFDDFTRDDI